jgi:spore coat protein H
MMSRRPVIGDTWITVAVTIGTVVALAQSPRLAAQSPEDLFTLSSVHRIDLRMHSQDWDKLKENFQENTYYPADLEWNGQVVRNAGVRSRGAGSRNARKPGLRVDFDRYSTEQTFLGLKSLVLDNLTQDPSGVRESVAMRVFDRLGVPAPREGFARLYVNGSLVGLYAVVESVDKALLARVFGAIDGNVQNDGYLFEYRYVQGSPWRFEYLGSDLAPYEARFDPKTRENEGSASKWGPIEELVRQANDASASRLTDMVGPRLDLAAFIRYVAIQTFIAENDGFTGYDGMNNFYFYRLEDRDQHVLIAWDADNAFLTPDFGITARHEENVLLRTAMDVPEWRDRYFASLGDAVESTGRVEAGQSVSWLSAEIARQLDLIAAAMAEDPSKPYSNTEHASARDAMLGFADARVSYVRCEIAKATGQARPAGCS